MTVDEGTFVLYSRIEPPLEAGDYRLTASQVLTSAGFASADLPVADLPTHLTVRSPRYQLPPDQVLSTFPPAGSEGAYGARLPQVVIRRRTLPWERLVQDGVARETPWLALVLIAEGEAVLKMNQPVADCVTPGVTLPGKADTELGNYLEISKSMLDKVFPTQLDVPLLAHAREVDINDTELMMGDDDGFLAVVIANRLPLSGHDNTGASVPVKYLACLVNLEGQFTTLLPKAPPPDLFTTMPQVIADVQVDLAVYDQARMGRPGYTVAGSGFGRPTGGPGGPPMIGGGAGTGGAPIPTSGRIEANTGGATAPVASQGTWSAQSSPYAAADVYTQMAADFAVSATAHLDVIGVYGVLDPVYRFPVLLHWSFTSYGDQTFRSLTEGLDSGLLGTVPAADATPRKEPRQPPLEIVETGHVGLPHRLRRGDPVRSWYRGPFVPHPTADPPSGRLPLAHAADQLRIVVPDGREDVSLAAAFDIGRLLALARPSMIAALMRWRQTGYQTARTDTIWGEFAGFLTDVLHVSAIDASLGVQIGRGFASAVASRPGTLLGDPRPLVDAGRALAVDGPVDAVLATGFGLDRSVFSGDPTAVLGRLRGSSILLPKAGEVGSPVAAGLAAALEQTVDQIVAGIAELPATGAAPGVGGVGPPGVGGAGGPGSVGAPGSAGGPGGIGGPGFAGGIAGAEGPDPEVV